MTSSRVSHQLPSERDMFDLLDWAFDADLPTLHEVGESRMRLILIALVRHADAKGECYPSQRRLAELARCDKRYARIAVKALCDSGIIIDTGKRKGRGVTVWRVGDAIGDVTGDMSGDVTGDTTGDMSGDVTGEAIVPISRRGRENWKGKAKAKANAATHADSGGWGSGPFIDSGWPTALNEEVPA